MLFAAMCVLWGIPYLLIKVAVAEVSVAVLVFARTALGALVLLPLAARRGALGVVRATAPEVQLALGGLGLLCTAAAFVLFFELIGEVGPTRAVVFTYVNPAVAVAAGVLLLGEPLTAAVLAAFVLILLGSILATRQRPVRQDRWA